MRRRRGVYLIILVFIAALVLFIFGAGESNEPDYTVFSVNQRGVRLLYDTLLALEYPVSTEYEPIATRSSVNDVRLVISPNNPEPDEAALREMLAWVRRGGRLIYLDNTLPTPLDGMLTDGAFMGNLIHYDLGLGEVVTGSSEDILNQNLMQNSLYGSLLQYTLDVWDADRIYFNEYYHGYHASGNLFARLPFIVKLVVYQIIIATAAFLWYKGKRFGKPIPYYPETEREEDEYIKALARLYDRTGGKHVKRHRRSYQRPN